MTTGIERFFEDYLKDEENNYGDMEVKQYQKARKEYRHAEFLCLLGRELYSVKDYKCPNCATPLDIVHEDQVVRTKCLNCDVSFHRPECKIHGGTLATFLVGNERTLLRLLFILSVADSERYSTIEYFKKVCDISEISRPLAYLCDKKFFDMLILERGVVPGATYIYRKRPEGIKYEEKLLQPIYHRGLKIPYHEFVDKRIYNEMYKNGIIADVSISSTFYPPLSAREGLVEKKERKIIVQHIE